MQTPGSDAYTSLETALFTATLHIKATPETQQELKYLQHMNVLGSWVTGLGNGEESPFAFSCF